MSMERSYMALLHRSDSESKSEGTIHLKSDEDIHFMRGKLFYQ